MLPGFFAENELHSTNCYVTVAMPWNWFKNMPKRLALIGDHVCDWIAFDEPPLGKDQVRIQTEFASGKYGTWAAMLDVATLADQVLDPRMRLFVPPGVRSAGPVASVRCPSARPRLVSSRTWAAATCAA